MPDTMVATSLPSFERLLESIEGVAYFVDGAGVIQAAGGTQWRRFAIDNGCPSLADPTSAVGLSICEFTRGQDVRETYRRHMQQVVGNGKGVSFIYSCDAPEVRRELRMAITPVGDPESGVAGALYQSLALSERDRPPVSLFDPAAYLETLKEEADRPIVRMCSFCHDVEVGEGRWVQAEDYYREGGAAEVRVSHGMCPGCFEEHNGELIGA